jgi:hypothetical protein
MIDLQNLKNAISSGQFSEGAKALMIPIVDAAIARGSMTAEEKKKLQDIMDVEFDGDVLEQSAHEEAAELIDSFLAETETISETASDNMDALEKDESAVIEELKNEAATAPVTAQPVGIPPQVSQPEPLVSQPSEAPAQPVVPLTETPPWQPPTQ